jgi:hypothetical protein
MGMTTYTDPRTVNGIEIFWSKELGWVTIPDREYCEHGLEIGSCPVENPED